MQRLGVIVNHDKERASRVLEELGALAVRLGLRLFADERAVRTMGTGAVCSLPGLRDHVEAVVALGGDGTLLHAARALDGVEAPILGINLGSLGYLTSVQVERLREGIECLRHDAFTVSRRVKLSAVVWRGAERSAVPDALNDVVVSRGASGRVVWLDVAVDGQAVATYVCDGLIVSTPTGSTAYSMSAGGPIVMPGTAATVISVICPHMLSSRPLVLPDSARIEITVRQASGDLLVSIDGQDNHVLRTGDRVEVMRGARPALFALLPGHNGFAVLSRKLGWGEVGRDPAR